MENHQNIAPLLKRRSISADQMREHLSAIATSHSLKGVQRGNLLQGHFYAVELGPGLAIHCVDALELANSRSSGEFAPGLSVNVLLRGELAFYLGSRSYTCEAKPSEQVLVLKSPSTEIFTRQIRAGQRVCKVNVTASEPWLRARLAGDVVDQLLAWGVLSWPADSGLVAAARKMLVLSAGDDGAPRLALEAAAIDLLQGTIACLQQGHAPKTASWRQDSAQALSARLDELLKQSSELPDIAGALGMSISTLQRKFKAENGITVMEYARLQRLEAARRALLIDGESVQQAAFLAGYDHPSNFVSAFKKHYKMTPAAMVKLHLGN
ncbi:helix-turn-helix transcriptional regulator [Gilvimarinus sp. SDUM040013]|uniref:Helix-turn-helix transcriptional regulator n=1 Tax=Gilvimarinus gilvus TaxID=3058038 RepID=A0ABU4RZJ5_9GAMM|nr:AraC family transcriptional regulator [Gilvimarinus sp. SDUM040013]MDO3384580.1 helix-turn-helix transcriptional regulator [Gilvimarinus sp. SDUM040013]MDX6850084.1 helix-turn-helix transcriptional regulator [Gilvimarinus sp. SDUM040013]